MRLFPAQNGVGGLGKGGIGLVLLTATGLPPSRGRTGSARIQGAPPPIGLPISSGGAKSALQIRDAGNAR